jgi:multiple sugar transport system substrate-binding protein
LSDGASYLNDKGEIDVVNAGFVKAFESYAELVHKQRLAPPLPATQDANTAWSLWAAGNAAMVVSGPWDVVNAKSSVKFDFGLATMPKGSKGSITIAGGSGFGISSSAKDRNLAFKAITALTSDEAEERLASAGLYLGSISSLGWTTTSDFSPRTRSFSGCSSTHFILSSGTYL